jgi:hypothetical protein
MNLAIIESATVAENRAFFKAAVERLAEVFPESLTQADAEVLGYALQLFTTRFADGFVLNGDDSVSLIGRSDAAIILSALCDGLNSNWEWWRSRISPSDLSASEFGERLERTLSRIIRHDSVKGVEK